jgi:hypothetical protein
MKKKENNRIWAETGKTNGEKLKKVIFERYSLHRKIKKKKEKITSKVFDKNVP